MKVSDALTSRKSYRSPLSPAALSVLKGVTRYFDESGWVHLKEFSLPNHRRADLTAINSDGELVIVEVKSCLSDFTSDQKWPEYQGYCDRFYFAVDEDFPCDRIPEHCGLLIADGFNASVIRMAETKKLHASRRKALTLLFAQTAARRLARTD